jgi:tyrosine phenol-lyase
VKTSIEPYRIKAVEPIPFTTRTQRARALEEAGYNLFRLPTRLVTIDLLTDSGFTAMSTRQWAALMRGDEAYAGAESFARFEEAVRRVTGLPHVLPTHQGRAAERLLFESLVRPGDLVPGNTHFDTTRANLERVGAEAVDLPVPAALVPSRHEPFKGNLDVRALADLLDREPEGRVRLVIATVTSNGCGGQPVSLANLRELRRLCDAHRLPLFLDAARFAENAWLIHEREAGMDRISPASIARAMFDLADGCMMSAKKDGLVNIGGFLALRDGDLAGTIRRAMVVTEGFPTYGGLAGRDLEALAVGLEEVLDPAYLADRIASVARVGETLHAQGVPTVRPPGGHAIYLDSRAFAPHLDPLSLPGQSIACGLYLEAGVRSVEIGQLMCGRKGPAGVEAPVPLDLVRLAIPRRVYTSRQLDYVVEAVAALHADRHELAGYDIEDEPRALRHFGARLRPRALEPAGVR